MSLPSSPSGNPGNPVRCPVCAGDCVFLGVVDFNKSCEEARGLRLPSAGIPIAYVTCQNCGFCHSPAMHAWTPADFAERVYNNDYVLVDPDYREARPRANAEHLIALFGNRPNLNHLDYGGGQGLMSDMLRDSGWRSTSFDPFGDSDVDPSGSCRFDLVTAYEVFEHVPDVRGLVGKLSELLAENGVVLFSTMLTDGNISRDTPLGWWYAAPRNGHISLFSRDSLFHIGRSEGLNFGSFSPNFHAFWRVVPPWASHILK